MERRHRTDIGHQWIHEKYGPYISSLFGDQVVIRAIDLFIVQNAQMDIQFEAGLEDGGYVGGHDEWSRKVAKVLVFDGRL